MIIYRLVITAISLILFIDSQSAGQIITTIAGNGIQNFSGDGGSGTDAELFRPTGVCTDAIGNIYIADYWNMRIRKLDTAGIISTIAGNGNPAFSGDGSLAIFSELFYPVSVCIDLNYNIYISDLNNYRIRKINSSGIITTVAGNGTFGFGGDGGPATAAELFEPGGIATDDRGNLFITDALNNRVRKVNPMGIISTFAGTGVAYFSGDGGPATAADLYNPSGVCVDYKGNVYISDETNSRIRKVDTSGIISTIAGIGTQGYSGDGGPATVAQLFGPGGLSMDASGNLYVADYDNFVIRKITPSGIISTVAGNGYGAGTGFGGYSGDGGPATAAELNFASDVCSDATGNLYIADQDNNRIRKVSVSKTNVTTITSKDDIITVYPNPATNTIYFQFPEGDVTVRLMNITGRLLNQQIVHNGITTTLNVSGYTPGLYIYQVITDGKTKSGKIIIEQ